MSNSAPREGRDHATSLPCAAAVAAVVALAAALAEFPAQQPAAQSAPCTTIADDKERLACYDRALRAASPEPAAQAPAAAPVQTPAAPAEAARTPASVQSAPQTAAPPPANPPAPEVTASQPQRDADKETIAIVIVGVRTMPGRETAFTAQDGATWVQTDSQRIVGLPDTPFEAELKPGAMGSRFLVPKSGARAIRVRPAER